MSRLFTCDSQLILKLFNSDTAELAGAGITIMDIVYVPGLWAGTYFAAQAIYVEEINDGYLSARGGTIGVIFDTDVRFPQLNGLGFSGTGSFRAQSLVGREERIGASARAVEAVLPCTPLPAYNFNDAQGVAGLFGENARETRRVHYPIFGSGSTHRVDRARMTSTQEALRYLGARAVTMAQRLAESPQRSLKLTVLTHTSYTEALPPGVRGTI